MSSKIYIKRTSVSGRTPNTSNLSTGELALNMTDGIMYSSNGSNIFEIGANVTSLSINSQYSFPTTDGTALQTLVTDGNGSLSFANVVSTDDINDILSRGSTIDGDLDLTGNTTANSITANTIDVAFLDVGQLTISGNTTANNIAVLSTVNIGNTIISASNSASTTTQTNTIIDTYTKSDYSSVQYLVEVTNTNGKQFSQINLIYDSNDVYVTEFGRLSTNNDLATFDANMSSTDVNLIISPLDNNLSIKVGRTSITS